MDNYSIHNGEAVRTLIEEAGAKLIFFPSYSPDFSPIENCFSKIKHILPTIEARNHPELVKAIEAACSQVSLSLFYQTGIKP